MWTDAHAKWPITWLSISCAWEFGRRMACVPRNACAKLTIAWPQGRRSKAKNKHFSSKQQQICCADPGRFFGHRNFAVSWLFGRSSRDRHSLRRVNVYCERNFECHTILHLIFWDSTFIHTTKPNCRHFGSTGLKELVLEGDFTN